MGFDPIAIKANGRIFGKGSPIDSVNLASFSFKLPFVCLTLPDDWGQ